MPPLSRPRDTVDGAVVAAVTLVVVVAVALASGVAPDPDRHLLAAAHAMRSPSLDALFIAVTWLGSLAVLAPLALVAAFECARRGLRREAAVLAGSLASAAVLSHLAKLAFARPRPDLFASLTIMPADLSFPSAHSAQAAAVALGLLFALRGRRGRDPVRTLFALTATGLAVLVILLVALVALSRVYLQVHFPSDVLAGLVLGAGCAWSLHRLIGSEPQLPRKDST